MAEQVLTVRLVPTLRGTRLLHMALWWPLHRALGYRGLPVRRWLVQKAASRVRMEVRAPRDNSLARGPLVAAYGVQASMDAIGRVGLAVVPRGIDGG